MITISSPASQSCQRPIRHRICPAAVFCVRTSLRTIYRRIIPLQAFRPAIGQNPLVWVMTSMRQPFARRRFPTLELLAFQNVFLAMARHPPIVGAFSSRLRVDCVVACSTLRFPRRNQLSSRVPLAQRPRRGAQHRRRLPYLYQSAFHYNRLRRIMENTTTGLFLRFTLEELPTAKK